MTASIDPFASDGKATVPRASCRFSGQLGRKGLSTPASSRPRRTSFRANRRLLAFATQGTVPAAMLVHHRGARKWRRCQSDSGNHCDDTLGDVPCPRSPPTRRDLRAATCCDTTVCYHCLTKQQKARPNGHGMCDSKCGDWSSSRVRRRCYVLFNNQSGLLWGSQSRMASLGHCSRGRYVCCGLGHVCRAVWR